MKKLDVLAAILVVIGAINWGLFGAIHMDLVDLLLGKMPIVARSVYCVVGIAGLYQVVFLKGIQDRWCKKDL